MAKRKLALTSLWLRYINQPISPSEETMEYVAALKARIDVLEFDKAVLTRQLILLSKEDNSL